MDKVTKALDSVRPALQSDGGDVELVDVKDKKVFVRLTGACEGCPSSTVTLKRGIMTALKKLAPEVEELIEVRADGSHHSVKPVEDDPWSEQKSIEGVKLVIAVASGKGGVGKSTIAVNLALALKNMGLKIGLLDADIYGPSTPTMLGVTEAPLSKYDKIEPAEAFGVKVISIGLFVPQDAAMIWRGPMVMKAVEQFLHDVDWGELDCLIVDLPPGTGDAQLSLAQRAPVDGVVIVTTPSDVALVDARRGMQMFSRINVRVLGIVENMSYFMCPHCGERTNIFSAGGGKETAEQVGTEFLGDIPLDPFIRSTGDSGKPAIIADPQSPQALRLGKLAERIWTRITTLVPTWDMAACHNFGLPGEVIRSQSQDEKGAI